MIRRPPRSTLSSSSAASDVYKRQRIPLLRRQSSHHLQNHYTHRSLMRWVGLLPQRHTCRSTPPFSSLSPTFKCRFPDFGRTSSVCVRISVAYPGTWTPLRRESLISRVSSTEEEREQRWIHREEERAMREAREFEERRQMNALLWHQSESIRQMEERLCSFPCDQGGSSSFPSYDSFNFHPFPLHFWPLSGPDGTQ